MFKNPLKYQQGGKAKQASQEQLVQLFQAAAKNAQVDPQELVQKASELGNDEQAAAQFMQGLQLCAQGDPKGIEFIKSLFQQPAYKKGGKILDFICKHAKGGYVSGCGCRGNVKKAQDGASEIGSPKKKQTNIIKDQEPAGPIPESPVDSISYYRPGKIVQNNNSFVDSLIGQRFLNLSNVSDNTFVPAPTFRNKITDMLRNSTKLSREEGLNRLESAGIPRFIGEDFGKTRRFLEVQGHLNNKK